MRALVWDGEALRLEERAAPRADGRARVRVLLAGVCSTDLQLLRGYMGFRGVPGHEVVGVVEEGPPGLVGRRVVAEINFACGACPACGAGLGRHCPTRQVMGILGADGAFAEQVLVPPANLHVVPDAVSDEEAVFAEPLAAAFEVLEQVHVRPGTRAAVLGDGKLGLLVALVLHAAGARVTCVGRHARKLEHLRRAGVEVAEADLAAAAAPAERVDLVVEATGSAAGLERAVQLVRPRGTLVLKSTVADAHRLSLAPLVIDEVTLVGSRCGPFAPALAALARRGVAVAPLVDAVYPLAEGSEAVAHAGRPGTLKVLLRP
ncbi:MAG: alcohol dehydrogenase catalytic domain-containing protein [Planctomycetes bacterium]|nr:alcohol dehydrogenase catalytic domain-containing protein [Planctomycetota bacterium]